MATYSTPLSSKWIPDDAPKPVTLARIGSVTKGRGYVTPGCVDKSKTATSINRVINSDYAHAPIWFQARPSRSALWDVKSAAMPDERFSQAPSSDVWSPKQQTDVPEPQQFAPEMSGAIRPVKGVPRLAALVIAVANVTGVATKDMLSERRHVKLVRARQIYYFAAREITSRSFPEIGRRCGGRDHSTVMHGIKKVENNRQSFEPELSTIFAMFPVAAPEDADEDTEA